MYVIGHYPLYLEVGRRLDAKLFSIPEGQWEAMSPEKRVGLNRAFLDEAMASGEEIILATDPAKVQPGSTLEMELDYLRDFGYVPGKAYRFDADGKIVDAYWRVSR
jgi:hypothetical protein